MASPHHRRQSSLQAVLDFSLHITLEPDQYNQASEIFKQIVSRCEPVQADGRTRYKYVTLLRTVDESVRSRDNFLNHFFLFVGAELRHEQEPQHTQESNLSQVLPHFDNLGSWNSDHWDELQQSLATFSDHLVDNFFLPLKASTRRTPQPTPTVHSPTQASNQVISTTDRLAGLRHQCLIRDRHRCVISHTFDLKEATKREKRDGENCKDDDERLLKNDTQRAEILEVAHILPHSLTSFSGSSENPQLSESKRIALQILNMFDPGIIHLIDGIDIDKPTNALTLTHYFRQQFGDFLVSFEPTTDGALHSYKIDHIRPDWLFRDPLLPITRTLYLTPDRTIDPPSPRLLAVHHAIARILYLSGAGSYIDSIIRDMEEVGIREDGSTELGRLVGLKTGGWLEKVPVH